LAFWKESLIIDMFVSAATRRSGRMVISDFQQQSQPSDSSCFREYHIQKVMGMILNEKIVWGRFARVQMVKVAYTGP
jgi:hypothetical protein